MSAQITCTHSNGKSKCDFVSDSVQFFDSVERKGRVGRFSACVNAAVSAHLLNTKTTSEDAVDLFSSLGLPMPTRGGDAFQAGMSSTADAIIDLHTTVTTENRRVVELTARLADSQGLADKEHVQVMFDGNYNVRNQKGYQQRATIADTVMLEDTTTAKYPLSYVDTGRLDRCK